MIDVIARLQQLPEVAFVDNPTTVAGCRLYSNTDAPVIGIQRGIPGYTPIYTPLGAEEINAMYGVTPPLREAMLMGSMFGWHTKSADPAMYDETGRPY